MKQIDDEFFTLDVGTNNLYPFMVIGTNIGNVALRLFKNKEVARAATTALNRSVNRILRSYRLRDDHLTKQEAIDNMAP